VASPAFPDLVQRIDQAIRSVTPRGVDTAILPDHSLVLDLGFDSMKVALLSLALEEQLGRTILLERWLSCGANPATLTVGSLHQYVRQVLVGDEEPGTTP
jgi:acyl carrier protein